MSNVQEHTSDHRRGPSFFIRDWGNAGERKLGKLRGDEAARKTEFFGLPLIRHEDKGDALLRKAHDKRLEALPSSAVKDHLTTMQYVGVPTKAIRFAAAVSQFHRRPHLRELGLR